MVVFPSSNLAEDCKVDNGRPGNSSGGGGGGDDGPPDDPGGPIVQNENSPEDLRRAILDMNHASCQSFPT